MGYQQEPAGPACRHGHSAVSLGTGAELLGGKGQQEPSPSTGQCHPERLRGAPPPLPTWAVVPLGLPQTLPICEATARFTAEGEAPAWLWEKGTGGKMPPVLHPLKSLLTPRRGSLPCPAAPGSDIPGAHRNPRGEINPGLSQRGGKRSLATAPDICRDLGSLQACGGPLLPLSQAVEDVQKHPTTAALHTWHMSPCQELKGNGPSATWPRRGQGQTPLKSVTEVLI